MALRDPSPDETPTGPEPSYGVARHGGAEGVGEMIGGFRLLEVIGEGGFGVVYLAERREPFVQRVALKVVKPGMDSRAVVARFEQERQLLAVMDHPNIAKVFDAGTTPAEMGSRPYFVMEHVRGEPITGLSERLGLSVEERLGLFIPVCEAVQHAHLKGVIHRDIKPGNILVSLAEGHSGTRAESAVPKIIDFGIAKALGNPMTDKTIFTEAGQRIGTPDYMSPEQADPGGVVIGTATDVFSLGVVLYELISGRRPFSGRSTGGVLGAIASMDPPPLHAAAGRVPRDLETICRKAVEKEPDRRYTSPSELAADLRRYLAGEPVRARPTSLGRRASRLLAGHRWVGPAAVVAVTALVSKYAWPSIFARTGLERRVNNAMTQWLPPPSLGPELRDVRIVALTERTDAGALARELGIEGVSNTDITSLRRLHAALLRRLGESGCTVVAFDVAFRKPTVFDQDFAEAARTVRESRGVDTVVAVPRWSLDEEGKPEISPEIAREVRWGAATGGFHTEELFRVEMLARRRGEPAMPSLALAALASHWAPGAGLALIPLERGVEVQHVAGTGGAGAGGATHGPRPQRASVVRLTSLEPYNPADSPNKEHFGLTPDYDVGVLLVPIADEPYFAPATVEYADVLRADAGRLRGWFAGRAVLVANMRPGVDVQDRPSGREIKGVWANAAAMQAVLLGKTIGAPSDLAANVTLVFSAGVGTLVGVGLGQRKRALLATVAATLGLAAGAVWVAYAVFATVWNPIEPVSGLAVGVFLGATLGRFLLPGPRGRALAVHR